MSVHKQTNKTWKVRYRIGAKQQSRSGFRTKREAEAYEAEQLRRARNGTWTDPQAAKVTVDSVFADWIQSKQIEDRTRYDYTALYRRMIAPTWAHVRLEHATAAKVTRWIKDLAATYERGSVQKAYTVLTQMFDWAVADERLAVNPAKRAKELAKGSLLPRKGVRKEKVFLTHKQVSDLASAAGEHGFMLTFMAYTGVRFGEVSALQLRDIDLLRGRVLIRRAYSETAGVLKEVPPKSGQPREIPIPSILRDGLEKALQEAEAGPESLLFPTAKGTPHRLSNWRSRVFNPAVKKAGLEGLTPHGLRHTYAALAVQAGANPKILQKAMGHSDIRLTLDTYGGLFSDDLDSLAAGLDSAVKHSKMGTHVPDLFPQASEVVRFDRTQSLR